MPTLIAIAIAGFIAQLVDGTLGMGYGVTSTSFLLTLGLTPAAASASVHLAEIGTSAMSGASHWRFGNVNARLLVLLGVPGGLGAFMGAVVLSNLALEAARPMVSAVLLVLGIVIVLRFIHGRRASNDTHDVPPMPFRGVGSRHRWALLPLGLIGGFLDASGGGGWGTVTTSSLMAATRMHPRQIIGTVSGSEFIVAVAASIGFLLALGAAKIDPGIVIMLLLGGAFAAPLSAWLVSRLNEQLLGAGVGGLIIFLNLDRALALIGADPSIGLPLRLIAVLGAIAVVGAVYLRGRSTRSRAGHSPSDRSAAA
jgi:uncharacterized membrane protein YfcA